MKLFLSHSKKDNSLAHRLANDLIRSEIDVWLDEREIFVGESIIKRIDEGLNSSDFLGLLITKNSLESNWVEREWYSVLNKEIKNKEIIVLPIKGDDCVLPLIIGDKMYADISIDYKKGTNKLIKSIKHHYNKRNDNCTKTSLKKKNKDKEIEVKFNKDFETFTESDKEKVARALSELMGIKDVIRIICVREGSVIIKFKLPDEKSIGEFFKIFNKNVNKLNAIDAWIVGNEKNLKIKKTNNNILKIEATNKTPNILLDAINYRGIIEGKSMPENCVDFYTPILDWFDYHINNKSLIRFDLDFKLEYYNTGSSKLILRIIEKLYNVSQNGAVVQINWYYNEDDTDIYEAGLDLSSLYRVPFNFLTY